MIETVNRAQVQAVKDGWVSFLSRYAWLWFTTNTFREEVHPERADKCYRYWLHNINRHLYGNRYQKKGVSVYGVKALEYQERGVIHFHSLLAGDGLSDVSRLESMDTWHELAGYARIYPPRSQEAVSSYVSKYVVKGGEIECVGFFPAYPAALLHEEGTQRHVLPVSAHSSNCSCAAGANG